jgi:glycosyltransferase involved in cell wall biosynthesis
MDSKCKIILVNSARKVSGAEEFLLDLAENIQPHGYSPSFFVRSGGVLETRVKSRGYPCHAVFSDNPLRVPVAIAAALRAEQPEIVLAGREHNIYPIISGYLLAGPWLKRRPKIVPALQTPTGRRYPFAINFLSGIVAGSEYVGQTFYDVNSGWKQRAETIYCGVRIPPIPEEKGNPNRPRRVLSGKKFPVIAMVGELWKNQTELIDIGALLQERFRDITIAFVGGGNDADLREKIASFGLEKNFVLTGRIPVEQIPDLFYDLDLSVSTHRNEGLGIANIASLAAATPLVAYNSGGIAELVRKGGGVLVDGGPTEFAETVIALLDSDERRRQLGLEGRRVVEENFSVETMGRRYHEFFRGLFQRDGK